MRDKIFEIMEGESHSIIGRLISGFIFTVILISSIAFVMETMPELHEYIHIFKILEYIIVAIFSIEYLIRISTARGRMRFMVKPLNIIDLLAVLPFYLSFLSVDLRILRVIRLVRIFRIFKLSRYSTSFAITMHAFQESAHAFAVLLVLMLLVLILFSSFMYFAESDAHISYCAFRDASGKLCQGQWIAGIHDPHDLRCPLCHQPITMPIGKPEVAQNFQSIPKTFWWCIVTMTTVGYGDVVPQTWFGKILAGLTMIAGILCIALPTGVMATTILYLFEEEKKKRAQAKIIAEEANASCQCQDIQCPNCKHQFKWPT